MVDVRILLAAIILATAPLAVGKPVDDRFLSDPERGGGPSEDRIRTASGGVEYVAILRSAEGEDEGKAFHGASVLWRHQSDDGRLQFVVVDVRDEKRFRASIQGDDNVVVADVNRPVRALFVPNDPCYSGVGCSISQYGPQLVGAEAAWDRTLGATAVKVGIADTGINKKHNDLPYSGGRVVAEKDCVDRKKDVSDGNGHGSHVTGIASGTTNNGIGIAGLAQASVIVAQVLGSSGSGSDASVACGIDFIRTSGGHVASMSLGSSGTLPATAAAIRTFWNGGAGGLPVAAAGNGGATCATGCVDFPGNMPEVLAVGAVDAGKARASFSDGGSELDLVAPGVDIWSTWKSCYGNPECYARLSGTSMATPHVAGVAALGWSANATLTAAAVRDRVLSTAEALGDAGRG
ncbi:MAG: S8 family peptidase, partial [Methanobacteriota archaeon]